MNAISTDLAQNWRQRSRTCPQAVGWPIDRRQAIERSKAKTKTFLGFIFFPILGFGDAKYIGPKN